MFARENYEFKSIKIKTLLISLDLWEVIWTEFEELESIENWSIAQVRVLKDRRGRNDGALRLIRRGVADPIFPKVVWAIQVKQAWKILKQECAGDVKVRVVKLQGFRKEFENLKLKLNENESVKEFCIRLIELINQMRISDEEIHDRKIIDKVQMRKKKFDVIVVVEETKDLSKLTIEGLINTLKSFDKTGTTV